jgi:hypothetical protein
MMVAALRTLAAAEYLEQHGDRVATARDYAHDAVTKDL